MIGTSVSRRNESFLQIVQSYYQLTKPRIIPLLLITTAAAMWIAGEGQVDGMLVFVTLLGGTLATASAQVLNCVYDRDIDYEMMRTRKRPIPSGRVQPNHALIFAIILGVSSFTILTVFANLISALLAMSGIVFYMLVYTHLLKRHTTQNIVIGGAAGSIPPLVGWSAVQGDLTWAPWILFLIIFLWTPPHFWALALMIRDEYAEVNVPMLPVVVGEKVTVNQMWLYTILMVACSFLLIYPLGVLGLVYGVTAIYLGLVFIKKMWHLKQSPENKVLAKGVFKYSILYMMLLCTGIVLDSLPLTHEFLGFVGENLQMAMKFIPLG